MQGDSGFSRLKLSSQIGQHNEFIECPDLAAADFDLDGDLDVAVMCVDRYNRPVIVLLQNTPSGFDPRKEILPLSGRSSINTLLSGRQLVAAPVLGKNPDLLASGSLYGNLSMNGASFLMLFLNTNKFKETLGLGEWKWNYPFSTNPAVFIENHSSTAVVLVPGHFGTKNPTDFVILTEGDFTSYSPQKQSSSYDFDSLDFNGFFRAGVAADIDGDGRDEFVLLGAGRLPGQEKGAPALYVGAFSAWAWA